MKKKHQKSALIILDMLNKFDFPEAPQILGRATQAARRIFALKRRLKSRKIPVIYVNDNFGKWHSDWRKIYSESAQPNSAGHKIAALLCPDEDDYFILKPKHSGFYLTSLELLLADLGVQRLILTGVAGNLCVLFTAHDAHMRNLDVTVAKDCIASNTVKDNDLAIHQIKNVLKLSVVSSKSI